MQNIGFLTTWLIFQILCVYQATVVGCMSPGQNSSGHLGGSLSQQIKSHYMMHQKIPRRAYTVKPVLSSHSRIDKMKVLKTGGSLMQV